MLNVFANFKNFTGLQTARYVLIGGVAMIASAMAAPAQAEVVWEFDCTFGTCSGLSGLPGNTRTFQAEPPNGSVQITAKAMSTTSTSNDAVEASFLGLFPGGLGNTAAGSAFLNGDGNGGFEQHTVDSFGPDDFVIFELPADNFKPSRFQIGYASSNLGGNVDVDTYIGGELSDDLLNALIGQAWDDGALLTDQGFVKETFDNVAVNTDQNFTNGATGRYLIIAAATSMTCAPTAFTAHSSTSFTKCGGFKISVVAGDRHDVPEPGSLSVFLLGLMGLGYMGWRRRSQAVRA